MTCDNPNIYEGNKAVDASDANKTGTVWQNKGFYSANSEGKKAHWQLLLLYNVNYNNIERSFYRKVYGFSHGLLPSYFFSSLTVSCYFDFRG